MKPSKLKSTASGVKRALMSNNLSPPEVARRVQVCTERVMPILDQMHVAGEIHVVRYRRLLVGFPAFEAIFRWGPGQDAALPRRSKVHSPLPPLITSIGDWGKTR